MNCKMEKKKKSVDRLSLNLWRICFRLASMLFDANEWTSERGCLAIIDDQHLEAHHDFLPGAMDSVFGLIVSI